MAETIDEIIHYGVKGMKWGRRKSDGAPTAATVTQNGKKLKGTGGENQPASKEAIAARKIGQQAKKSGIASLSNAELRAFNERLNLEQQANRLRANESNPAGKFVKELLLGVGKQQAVGYANQQVAAAIKKKPA